MRVFNIFWRVQVRLKAEIPFLKIHKEKSDEKIFRPILRKNVTKKQNSAEILQQMLFF